MKKISLVLLCGVILLGVCGCGNNEESLSDIENNIYTAIVKDTEKSNKVKKITLVKVGKYEDTIYLQVHDGEYKTCKKYYEPNVELWNGYECDTMQDYSDISIEKINNKLKKHWEDLGL